MLSKHDIDDAIFSDTARIARVTHAKPNPRTVTNPLL